MLRTASLSFLLTLILALVFTSGTFVSANAQNKKVVFLKNKNNSPYSISNPETYLSGRSIQRRKKFNIAIDSSDLPINPNYIATIGSLGNVRILGKSKWMNALIIECSDVNTMNQIENLPFVKSFSNIALRIKDPKKSRPEIEKIITNQRISWRRMNDPSSRYLYGSSYNQINMHNGHLLHNIGADGQNMMIAIFDSGFNGFLTNSFLDSANQNNQIVATKDIVNDNASVNEDDAHGLYCLSVMAGNKSGEYVGSCPKAQFVLLRTEDVASEQLIEEYFWAIGAEYADSCGADVFTSSVGYTTFDDPNQNHVYSDLNGNKTIVTIAADKAASKGIFVVTSAGNEGGSSWKYIGSPADGDSVYAVGAVDFQKNIAGFSSFGPTYDGRVKPDGLSIGLNTYLISSSGSIINANGTSFSTPNLAGLITCIWQLFPDISNAELMQTIRESSDRFNNPLPQYGYGIPDMAKALAIIIKQRAQFSFTVSDCKPTLNWKSYDYKGMGYLIQRKFANESNYISIDKFYSSNNEWRMSTYKYSDLRVNKNVQYRILQLLDTSNTKPLHFVLDSANYILPESCLTNNISIYPNPAQDFFKLEIVTASAINAVEVVIFNNIGQQIKSVSIKKPAGYFISPAISTYGLSKGVYIIKVFNDNKELITQKLLIQ